jgi:salicylate hydroxylase
MAASHGVSDRSYPTGDAAYRILIPREKLQHDQEALSLLDENVGMRVMGPGGHCMMYPIKPSKDAQTGREKNMLFNMVLLHPAKAEQLAGPEGEEAERESWTNKGSKQEMLDFYKGWASLIQNQLSYVPEGEVMEWTLNMHQPLPTWEEGSVAPMGDACHPML